MEDELDLIIQNMVSAGESEDNIALVINSYNSEKKKSTPISTPQKSGSGTPTGSSGGVNPAFKSSIPSPIPDFNSMQSVKSVVDNKALAKSKRLKELETSFYASTKDDSDDAVAEQRLQDRKANKGFWNTAEDLTKSAYNKVIGGLASIADEPGIRDLKTSEDPLADEKKQALLEAKKNKITLTEAQKKSRAEEIFKQKEKDNLFIDRANSYLDNLDVKDKDILEQSRLDKSTHLQLENQKKFKVVSAMETVGNEKIKEYQAVEKQLLDLKKNGQEFPKELYDKYSNLGVEINQISGNIQKYSDQIQKNKSDLGTIEQEYDLFKRGYGDMDNFMGNAIATSGELANGIFGAVNYFASLSPDPITRLNSMRGQEIANKISGKLEEYRGALRKPVESVESAEGFVNYASDLVANQLPVLAVTSTGAGGLATLGASTTGQTFTKLNQEVLTGKANYTPLQMVAIPLLQGGFEVISEIPTLSILKKGSRVLSAAANGEIDLIKKSGGEIFKDYAKDFGKEFGGEHITNLGQNFNAKYVQGKDEVGLLDNTGRVSKDTAFLTTLLQGSPHVFGAVAKVFQSNNDLGTLDENSRKIIEFSKQLNTEGLTDTEKTVIQKQIDKVTDDSSKIVANTIGKIGDMPNVSYDEIVSLNSQAGKIKAQAKEIKEGNLPNKKELLTSLGEDYKALQIKRSGLIDGSITPFDLLSGNEQAKRLTQASREITKRDNPDGTKEKFEVKPEDAKELASENYLKEIKYKENEQTPPTPEAQPQAEVPQQAEAEKVDSVELKDNVFYHGTPTGNTESLINSKNIDENKFGSEGAKKRASNGLLGKGLYLTNSKDVAKQFGEVLKVTIKKDIFNASDINKTKEKLRDWYVDYINNKRANNKAIPFSKEKANEYFDSFNNQYDEEYVQALNDYAKENGYGGVKHNDDITVIWDNSIIDKIEKDLPQEVSTVEDVVATSVEEQKYNFTKTPSLENAQAVDIKDANIDNEPEITEKIINNQEHWDKALVDGVKNEGNGWFEVGKTVQGESVLHAPSTNETVVIKDSQNKGGRNGAYKNNFIENNPRNEATPPTNPPTNGNVQLGASNVGESGNSKQESPVQESVSSSVDGGEVKGDVEVGKIKPNIGDKVDFGEGEEVITGFAEIQGQTFIKSKPIEGNMVNRESLNPLSEYNDVLSKQEEYSKRAEENKKAQKEREIEAENKAKKQQEKQNEFEDIDGFANDKTAIQKGKILQHLNKQVYRGTIKSELRRIANLPHRFIERDGKKRVIYTEENGTEFLLSDVYTTKTGLEYLQYLVDKNAKTVKIAKVEVSKGKQIEPHSEVNTDVETVKKELNLNEVDNLLYDELKDTPADKVFDKIDKIKDDKLGEIETIEKKMDDVDLKMEDNGDAIDKIDEDETLSAAKKKKAIAVLEKEFKDLQKQRENLESQKEGVEKMITDIDDALFHPTEDYNADKVSELINKVNTRLETRKSIKEGTNLFPEDANIPEFVAVKKELIKLTDEKTIADFNSRTAEQVKESEPIIADIKSKAKNAERISKEELEKGIADAEKLLKPPTTKERIAERIKLSDAKVDDWKNAVKDIDSIFGIKIKVDDIDGLNKNGIDIVEVIANIAKQAIAAGIHIDEAINKTIEHLKKTIDFDVNIDEIKEKINPKNEAEKETTSDSDMEDFRDSWNLDPSSDEINQYDSGRTIAREHSETRNNQDYEVQKDFARVQIGIRAIEHAKRLFGAEYVEKTLSFIEQANLSPEKKAVAYVLLENEMDARAKEFPKNVGVQKLQDLVRAKSQEFLANSARAMGAGRFRIERFRELAKNGFSEEEFTNAILTTKQKNDKGKIQKLIQVSPDDINNESENQESDEDFVIEEPTVKRNKEAVKKDISNVLAQMRKDLLKVAKGNAAMSSIPYAAQLQAVAPHIIKLSKLLAELGGMTTRQIVNEVYNDIKEVFPGINKTDVSDILKEHSIKKAKPKTEAQEKQDSVKEIVKKALIEKGFSREITVTKNQRDASGKLVKDADGRNVKIKEKRTVLDWKKLAGEAGTISNIRKNVEESLKGSKYSKAEINEMKKALEREYVRLTSDVIEKGLNELQNRNADRKPVNTKSAAKKLAELYNYGLFEKNKDSYEKIINSVLGFNGLDQMAFDEMKEIARGYAVLMDSGLSDTEIKSAVNSLSRRQSRLVATLAFSQADWKFKLAVALSEITNLSTRFKLVNLGNLAENISSGMMARAANNMMDAMANIASGKKTSNKAIKAQSKINARAKLRGITLEAAESYGDTSSLLLNHSAVEDYFNNATTNKVYHAIISTYMAKPVLEGADSYNKILITEAKMVRATIKVLEAKGMSNSDALDYVANALTGESMKEALVKAKELIEKVNKDAGRKLLNDSESSIKSLAADIVKESLVSGGQLSETELKAIYTAAYKSAGKDIGHVSNNWVTDQISAKGAQVEKQVADAIQEKKWSNAAGAVVNQIFWKNFISTFVGGGTNWFVKGLQKSANPLSLVSLRDDVMHLKMAGKLDVTTDEGIKNMEESLYRGMNLRSTSATMLMGAIITASIIGGMSASGADDEIEKWLKENKWAKKYFDKTVPDAVVLMLAIKDKDFGRYIAKMVNVKADFFDDQKNTYKILEKYAKGYTEDDAVKISEASGDLGAMLGKRFEFPGPVRAAKDVKQIYKGLVKGEYDKTNYYTSGFMNGFFQGGIVESFGLRKDPDFIEDDPIQKFLKKQEKIKEYHALPQSEKDKVDSNAKIPSLRGAITEQENMKYAIKTKTPYYVKGDSEPIDLSDITIAEIDETIADLKNSIEEMKKEAGDKYKEPKN